MKMLRPSVLGLFGALAAVLGFLLWTLASSGSDPVIARVDGIDIRQSRADSRIAGIASMHGDVEATLGPDWRSVILESLVDDVILQIEGEQSGLTATDEDIAAELADTQALVGDDEAWEAWLDERGIDDRELERRLAAQIVANRVFNHVTDGLQATDAEVRQYYDDHPDVFTTGDGLQEFAEVESLILEELTARAKDTGYRDWLSARRAEVEIEVLHDDWK